MVIVLVYVLITISTSGSFTKEVERQYTPEQRMRFLLEKANQHFTAAQTIANKTTRGVIIEPSRYVL